MPTFTWLFPSERLHPILFQWQACFKQALTRLRPAYSGCFICLQTISWELITFIVYRHTVGLPLGNLGEGNFYLWILKSNTVLIVRINVLWQQFIYSGWTVGVVDFKISMFCILPIFCQEIENLQLWSWMLRFPLSMVFLSLHLWILWFVMRINLHGCTFYAYEWMAVYGYFYWMRNFFNICLLKAFKGQDYGCFL